MRFLIPALLFFAATAHAEEAMCPQLDYELAAPQAPEEGKLVLSADRVLMEQDGLSSLAGAVKLMQDDKQFIANALDFDSATRTVRIGAESLFRNEGLIIKSQSAVFDLNAETGVFQQPQFTLPSRAARGKADSITLSGQGTAELAGVRYTTCAPDSQAWDIAAENIELDPEEGLGTARNARLRLGNVPVLYLPYFQFPIDDRRRTGLLFPTTGGTNQTGFDLRLPIYLNLAPNYDATLTPRYMARRGVQLGGDTRYLYTRGEGDAHVEWLPKDEITDEARTYFQTDHQGLFNRRLGYQLDYGHASDQGYFEDLGGSTDLSSITHLERRAQLTYQAPAAYTIRVLAQDYQTISRTVLAADEPYARLPQVVLTARTKKTRYLSRAGITGEFVSFARELSLEGQRVDLDPYIRTEKQSAAWYLASQTNLRYTAYQLSGPVSIVDRTPSRSLPQFSAEGGLRFERVTNGGQLQTLEPYVFYLYTPFRDQSTLPLFDSGVPDFDYTQLFARNRLTGADRISDANQITFAGRTRLLDPESGEARLSIAAGQLFRFTAPRVALPGEDAPDRGATDFFTSLDWRISSRFSSFASAQWSPDDRQFNRTGLGLSYRDQRRAAQIAYRYRADLLEQADASISLPIGSQWRIAAHNRFSLREHQTLDALAGLEYQTCCWALRGSYRRYIANTAGEYNNGIYLQIELKGLTRIGAGFAGLLPLDESVGASGRY